MAHNDFSISITDKAVDVRYTPSVSEPRGKLFGFIFIISMLILLACAFLFLPGKHGNPSPWHDLASAPADSSDFFVPIIGLTLFTGLFGWQGFRYARAAWASDETFHCDHEAITISRIPWLDFSNRTWRTYTYPLAEVSKVRFAVIASAKGRQFWGLRFWAHGRRWALPGLEAPAAKTILTGLRTLAAARSTIAVFGLRAGKPIPISVQKRQQRKKADAFVPVDKRMILDQSPPKRRGQRSDGSIRTVAGKVLGSRYRRLQQATIA